ncbi:hypothetical protein NYR55_06450 [Sphingomonas sp. BGYR3]|uniref:hypothetical protein n=1 Tax=Sphingomonas sp. BGYR3 TaxID=2975483 RepID=UPI0021A84A15|nr:hypothetical protein [Sphingomonas sp. BGYR3]MDG5488259.1 hypothetical protein [Sphingomonas sp. BGYR3]
MYSSLLKTIQTYWRENGGFVEWISSPFFHSSVLFSILYSFNIISFDWREISKDSLPTILGFSLAAYTITFTLMGSALHRALSTAIDKKSGMPLIRMVNATFFHVVLFQSLALLFSLSTDGDFYWRTFGGKPGFADALQVALFFTYYGGNFVGCFLTIYGVFLLLSVGLAMFRLGRLTTMPAKSVAANSNDLKEEEDSKVTRTWRFALVKGLAKILRLYR